MEQTYTPTPYTPTPTPYTPSYTPTPTPIYKSEPSYSEPLELLRPTFVDDVATPAAPVFSQMEQTYTTNYEPTPIYKSEPSYSEPLELIRPTFVDDLVTPVFKQTAAPVDAMMEQTTPIIYSDARNELPFIPNWNSLDCQQFDTQLGNLQSVIRETRFTPAVYAQIQQAIQDGEKVKASKCASAPVLIINATPLVENPVQTPIIKKVPIPLIIEKDGTLVTDSIGGGTNTPSNTGGGTFVDDGTPIGSPIGSPTFVDDKASIANTTTSTLATTKKGTLPTAPVSKNLKPYVWALGGIVAILVVSRVLSKKS